MRWLCLFALTIAAAFSLQTARPAQNSSKPNRAPVIESFTAFPTTVTLCPFGHSCAVVGDQRATLRTTASDPDGDVLNYRYSVPAGSVEGTGSTVFWNLEKQEAGQYSAEVVVEDQKGNKANAALMITAAWCTTCDPPPPPCPAITVECPSEATKDRLIEFTATVKGGDPNMTPSYRWWTSSGKIVRGENEKKLTVELTGFPFETVTATISVGGADPSCIAEASCTTTIKQ